MLTCTSARVCVIHWNLISSGSFCPLTTSSIFRVSLRTFLSQWIKNYYYKKQELSDVFERKISRFDFFEEQSCTLQTSRVGNKRVVAVANRTPQISVVRFQVKTWKTKSMRVQNFKSLVFCSTFFCYICSLNPGCSRKSTYWRVSRALMASLTFPSEEVRNLWEYLGGVQGILRSFYWYPTGSSLARNRRGGVITTSESPVWQ